MDRFTTNRTSESFDRETLRAQLIPPNTDEAGELEVKRLARFRQLVSTPETWFYAADGLIAAMTLLEPSIQGCWTSLPLDANDLPTESATSHQRLIEVHMMLAGFAIENFCKGYLAVRLRPEEEHMAKGGILPKSLRNHRLLELVNRTGISVSEIEKDLVQRLGDAVWRGRYPCGTSYKTVRPFAQYQTDIFRIKELLQRLRKRVGAKST